MKNRKDSTPVKFSTNSRRLLLVGDHAAKVVSFSGRLQKVSAGDFCHILNGFACAGDNTAVQLYTCSLIIRTAFWLQMFSPFYSAVIGQLPRLIFKGHYSPWRVSTIRMVLSVCSSVVEKIDSISIWPRVCDPLNDEGTGTPCVQYDMTWALYHRDRRLFVLRMSEIVDSCHVRASKGISIALPL